VIIQLARNGIVEAITRAFKAESPSVSSIWPTVLLAAKTYAKDPLKGAVSAGFCTFEG
jgi:hypothetical protein